MENEIHVAADSCGRIPENYLNRSAILRLTGGVHGVKFFEVKIMAPAFTHRHYFSL